MLLRPSLILSALHLMIMVPDGAGAQQPTSRDCLDDRGVDRCAEARQRRVRDLFGVPSIEEHARAGDQVRRVFYVDGYGRDLLLISFVRSPGSDPMFRLHFPRRTNAPPTPPITFPVPLRAWQDILMRSEIFDRPLGPQSSQSNAPVICLHAWVYTVEATDPEIRHVREAATRRATEGACNSGAVGLYATEVGRAAIALAPPCASLAPDLHRNDVTRLAVCERLGGDRLTAAAVLNRAMTLQRMRNSPDPSSIRALFGHTATLDWNGERTSGYEAASSLWLSRVSSGIGVEIDRIEGLNGQRARLAGHIIRHEAANHEAWERAPLEMIWQFTGIQDFQVESATVGAFTRYNPLATAPAPASSRGSGR